MKNENFYPETYNKIGKSIFVFNEIEFFIDCIIAHFIKPHDREFFIHYFLNNSVTNFGTKIKMLAIFEKCTNKEIKMLREYAQCRNIFAHSNRTSYYDVKKVEENLYNVGVEDVIYITNSSGKITRKTYNDLVIAHENLQKDMINFMIEFILKHKINVIPSDVNNLKRFC